MRQWLVHELVFRVLLRNDSFLTGRYVGLVSQATVSNVIKCSRKRERKKETLNSRRYRCSCKLQRRCRSHFIFLCCWSLVSLLYQQMAGQNTFVLSDTSFSIFRLFSFPLCYVIGNCWQYKIAKKMCHKEQILNLLGTGENCMNLVVLIYSPTWLEEQ